MALQDKVELVRQNMISAVQVYKDELVGKRFLYIFKDEFIEVIYKIENFMHLTGVDSRSLSPKKFYEKTKDKTIKRNHMYFSNRYPLKTALEKSNELVNIDIFSNTKIFVVKNIKTKTYTYAFSFSDKKMTLGLTKDTVKDSNGNKIELDYYVPQTLRVKEDATEGKDDGEVVNITMILSKTDASAKYTEIHYGDRKDFKLLSKTILNLIDNKLYKDVQEFSIGYVSQLQEEVVATLEEINKKDTCKDGQDSD